MKIVTIVTFETREVADDAAAENLRAMTQEARTGARVLVRDDTEVASMRASEDAYVVDLLPMPVLLAPTAGAHGAALRASLETACDRVVNSVIRDALARMSAASEAAS